jgi:hypothetical protein
MTKTAFIAAYRAKLIDLYAWAQDATKLDRFMSSVASTIGFTLGGTAPWNHEGAAVTAAWREIGGKGKPTLKALRALERGEG